MLGAALEAVPFSSRVHPDVSGICNGEAQISFFFSHDGPGILSSLLRQEVISVTVMQEQHLKLFLSHPGCTG